MAATTSAHAGDAALAEGAKVTHAAWIWLRYAERFHFHVQESLRNHAKLVF